MPTITINGTRCEFKPGQMILQVALDHGLQVPYYCYHDGLSIVASCRICLGEIWAPNPRAGNKLEPYMGGKLMPTCQTPASDGMVVHTDSPKSVANQKAVMEYLLINHPLDCPVCDQAGECLLQDYSYQFGRGVSRFEEQKVKNPKKDIGPHIYLYSDRCIMCSRCVRFTREVTGTGELMVAGRGNKSEIDVFPGRPLDNPLSGNVADLCPVGALLDKDFLFQQRVWFLKQAPSIDPLTPSGDNIWIEHNDGKIWRIKPRKNTAVNKWWITDEVRYGWKFVHSPDRLKFPRRREFGILTDCDWTRALEAAVVGLRRPGRRIALLVSPMLTCEEAFGLAQAVRGLDGMAVLAVGPIPVRGEDRVFPPGDPNGYRQYAEKCPNARGIRRVLEAIAGAGNVLDFDGLVARLGKGDVHGVVLTGNYPSAWETDGLVKGLSGKFVVLIDTLNSRLADEADVVLPGATWAEKGGTFENARGLLQSFEPAIPALEFAKPEGQIALDLLAAAEEPTPGAPSLRAPIFNAANVRAQMAGVYPALGIFATNVTNPAIPVEAAAGMEVVEL